LASPQPALFDGVVAVAVAVALALLVVDWVEETVSVLVAGVAVAVVVSLLVVETDVFVVDVAVAVRASVASTGEFFLVLLHDSKAAPTSRPIAMRLKLARSMGEDRSLPGRRTQ
jgi:hypothetical protein